MSITPKWGTAQAAKPAAARPPTVISVELMGCTPAEATRLRRVLLRHRAVTAAVGAAAALSWVAVAAPSAPVEPSTPATLSGVTSGASYFDTDHPDAGGVTAPVQDALDGTWSPSYTATAASDEQPPRARRAASARAAQGSTT